MRNGTIPMPSPSALRHSVDVAPTDPQLLERFVLRQDAVAMATLIERHGPMVLGVCRRVLNHEQEAEDAFQSTFLVLVRRAATLERPELLGNWLYGVAYRTAQKARVRLARRRHHEGRVQPMPPAQPRDEMQWQELRSILDQELRELPAKFRAPLVLCYLEGMTNEEAARRLGWPPGSMSYRLARGRQMLRDRLSQRQQILPGMVVAGFLRRHAAPEAVPPDLAAATLRAVLGRPGPAPVPVPPPPLSPLNAAAASAAAAAPQAVARRSGLLVLLLALMLLGGAAVTYLALTGGYDGVARELGFGGWSAPFAPVEPVSADGAPSCH